MNLKPGDWIEHSAVLTFRKPLAEVLRVETDGSVHVLRNGEEKETLLRSDDLRWWSIFTPKESCEPLGIAPEDTFRSRRRSFYKATIRTVRSNWVSYWGETTEGNKKLVISPLSKFEQDWFKDQTVWDLILSEDEAV